MLLDLDLRGWPCLVVGGGPVGTRRAERLVDAGASVVVVAPDATAQLRSAHDSGRLRWEPRPFEDSDAAGVRLVVVATDSAAVDDRVAAAADPGTLVARSGDAARTEVSFPAVAVADGVVVTVATPARVPGLSRWVAERIAGALDALVQLDPGGRSLLAELLAEVRSDVPEGLGPGGVDWRSGLDRTMLDPVLLDLIRRGRRAEAKERLLACLSSS